MQLENKLALLVLIGAVLAPAGVAVDINDTYALRYYSDSTLDFQVSPNGDTDITGDIDMGTGQEINNYFDGPCGEFRAVQGINPNGTWQCTEEILEEKTEYLNETLSAGNTANVSINMTGNNIDEIGDLNSNGTQLNIGGDVDFEENNIQNLRAIQDGGSDSIEFQEDNDVRITNGKILMNGNSVAQVDNLNFNGGSDSLSEILLPNNGGVDQFNIADADGTGNIMKFLDSGKVEIPNGNLNMSRNDIENADQLFLNRVLKLNDSADGGGFTSGVTGTGRVYFAPMDSQNSNLFNREISFDPAEDYWTVESDLDLDNNNLRQVEALNSDGSTTNIDLVDGGNVDLPNGNLDINTPSNTGGALDVGGDTNIDGVLSLDNSVNIEGETADEIGFNNNDDINLDINSSSGGYSSLRFLSNGNNARSIGIDQVTGNFAIGNGNNWPGLNTNSLVIDDSNNVRVPNGNVGIGTDNPQQLLHVNGSSAGYARIGSNSDYLELGYDGSNKFMQGYGSGDLLLNYNNGEAVRIGAGSNDAQVDLGDNNLQVMADGEVKVNKGDLNLSADGAAINFDAPDGTNVPLTAVNTQGSEYGLETTELRLTDGRFDFEPLSGKAEFRIAGANTEFNLYNTGSGEYLYRVNVDGNNNFRLPNGNLQMQNNTIQSVSNIYDNETNANFFQDECAAGNVIKGINSDGTYNCVASEAQIQDIYVNESGDNMTGNLDMNGNQIKEIGTQRTNFTNAGRLAMGSEIDMNGNTIREAPRIREFGDINLDIDTNNDQTDRSLDITSDDQTNSIASFNEQSIDMYKDVDMNENEVQNVVSNSAGDAVNRSWVNQNIVNGTFLQRSYTGKFTISSTGEVDVTGLPFQPDSIEFTTQMPVHSANQEEPGPNGDSTSNVVGTMTGYARQTGFGIEEFAMSSAGSGDSINNVRMKSTESASIAMSYGDTNGAEIGAVNATVASLNGNGFTMDVREFDIDESQIIVQFTAFRATNFSTGDGLDVSEDGSLLVQDATDINFGRQLEARADGDGSVTVDKQQSNLSEVLEKGSTANQSIDMDNNDLNNVDQITLPDNSDPSGKNMIQIGDDSFLTDIDTSNRLGIYGANDNTVGEVQLGSSGPALIGQSDGDLEISENLQVGGNQILDSNGNIIVNAVAGGRRNIYDGAGNDLISVGGDGGSDTVGLTTIQNSAGTDTARFLDNNNVGILNGNLDMFNNNITDVRNLMFEPSGGTASDRVEFDLTDISSGANMNIRTSGGAGNDNDITVYDDQNGQDIARFVEGGNVEVPNGNLDIGADLRTSGATVVYDQSEGEIIANPGITSATNPVFTRDGDKDTGVAFSGSDTLRFTTGGTGGPLINSNQNLDMSGNILQNAEEFRGAAGTSGDPLYTFSGDRDTGLYRSGMDGLGIATGASTALNIDSSQNVNISSGNLRLAQVNSALNLEPSSMGTDDTMRINFSDPDGGTGPMSIRYKDDGVNSLDLEGGEFRVMDGNLFMNSNNITGTTRVEGIDLDSTGNGITIDSQDRYEVTANSLNDDEIADNSLTNTSLDSSGSFSLDQLQLTSDLTGTGVVDTTQLATSAVTSSKIGAGEVQNSDIAADAVDTNEIAENAVTNTQLDNSDAYTIDGLTTTSNIDMNSNSITSNAGSLDLDDDDGTDLNGVTMDAVSGMHMMIDSNDNTASSFYAIGKDATDKDQAGYQELMRVDETGDLYSRGDFFTVGDIDLNGSDLTDVNRIEGDDSDSNFFQDECSKGNVILGINADGSYDCVATEDQINDIWVNESGDNMTGDLNMNANRMRDVGLGNIQIGDGEGDIEMNGERITGGSMIQVDSLGITSSETTAENELSGNSIYVENDVSVDGNVVGAGADVAEKFENETELEPGTVVQVTGEMKVDKTDEERDTDVVGVVSTDAFIIMAKNRGGVPVAMSGTAPVKVIVEDGEKIMPGDFLTTAERDGWAKKCESINACTGAIIGKAMESQDKTGKVSMLVSRG